MPANNQLAMVIQVISIVTFIASALTVTLRIGRLIERIEGMMQLSRQWQEQHEKRDDERFSEVRADIAENRAVVLSEIQRFHK